jgi:hypothetical protein
VDPVPDQYRLEGVSEKKCMFGPKREAVIGGWRQLTNEQIHNLFFSFK